MTTETPNAKPAACGTCPLCGGPNHCQPAMTGSFEGPPCWCTKVEFSPDLLARIPPEQQRRSCICQSCATGGAQ